MSPAVFHANKVELLGVSREDLPGIVDELVRNTNTVKQLQGLQIAEPGFPPTDPFPGPSEPLAARRSHYTGVPTPGSRLALDIGTPGAGGRDPGAPDCPGTLSIYVASTEKHPKDPPFVFYAAGVILALPDPKNEPKRYSSALTAFVSIARHHLSNDPRNTVLLHPGRQRDVHTAIRNHRLVLDAHASPDGVIRNHSLDGVTHDPPDSLSPDELVIARKTILPLALLLLCALPEITSSESEVITKAVVADRFHGLIALWPDGNPSRAALKRVNEYLMSEGRG